MPQKSKTSKSIKAILLTAAALMLVISAAGSALAHAPVLWCYVEGGKVHVEAFFSGGAKIQDAQIFVVDKDGKKLLEGRTSKEGLFEFDPPVKDDLTIVLKVDSGHSADFTITKQDFIDAEKEAGQEQK
jgi:hypothetical protein